jgi:hypothetical protein
LSELSRFPAQSAKRPTAPQGNLVQLLLFILALDGFFDCQRFSMGYADKDQELEYLQYFISARESAIGERLEITQASEAPDFICVRPDRTTVGVEHTKVAYEAELSESKRTLGEDREIDNVELFWAAYSSALKKSQKRKKTHWQTPDATILVLDLVEGYRIEEWPDNSSLADDFADFGFIEIWLSDYSSVEAFSKVTLLGIYPHANWGLHGQGYLYGKPYR